MHDPPERLSVPNLSETVLVPRSLEKRRFAEFEALALGLVDLCAITPFVRRQSHDCTVDVGRVLEVPWPPGLYKTQGSPLSLDDRVIIVQVRDALAGTT